MSLLGRSDEMIAETLARGMVRELGKEIYARVVSDGLLSLSDDGLQAYADASRKAAEIYFNGEPHE